jgi:hypothetical protein
MKIEDVKYRFDSDGYAFLQFQMDGQPVELAAVQFKRSILQLGYVSFGAGWADRFTPFEVPADGQRNSFRIIGVKNEDLARIAIKFLDDLALGLETPS